MSITFFKISLHKFKRVEVGLYRWMRQEKLWQCLGALYQLSRHGTHLEIFGSDFPIFLTWTLILENPWVKELASVASFFHSLILFPQAHKTYSQKVASHFTASVQKYDTKKRNARTFVCQNGCPLTSNYISLKVWRFPWLFPLWLILVQGARAGGMVSNGAEKCSLQTWSHFTLSNRFREGWEPHFAVQHEAFWRLQEPLRNMQLFRLHGKDTLWRSEVRSVGGRGCKFSIVLNRVNCRSYESVTAHWRKYWSYFLNVFSHVFMIMHFLSEGRVPWKIFLRSEPG